MPSHRCSTIAFSLISYHIEVLLMMQGVGPSIAISFSVYEALRSYWHSQRCALLVLPINKAPFIVLSYISLLLGILCIISDILAS